MASLAELRQKLKDQETKRGTKSSGSADKSNFPFWDMNENDSATVRFLPDANTDNTFFWVEKQQIKIPFSGIVGMNSKPTVVTVPCVEMWGESCPIHQEIRPWFKDSSLEKLARTYWKKRSYIFQGLVRKSPLVEQELPENPIRKFTFGSQIFNLVKSSLLDPEMENIPTDYLNGTDFQITKLMKGQYADYATSKWARKESSLTEEEFQAIQTYGLYDLSKFLPAKPDAEALAAIFEMFEESVEGKEYDPQRWGKYYRPYGVEVPTNTSVSVPVSKPEPKTTVSSSSVIEDDNDDLPWEDTTKPVEPAKSASNAQDIIALIRARQNSGN
ncbi:hypothetical protein RVBP17_1170 [Pseudomonas phage sp. 30-3]|nr:hypothetical protein RVBP17_1170 [Pseudomonas phage sp. 30-3]